MQRRSRTDRLVDPLSKIRFALAHLDHAFTRWLLGNYDLFLAPVPTPIPKRLTLKYEIIATGVPQPFKGDLQIVFEPK
jgi:hypothetical protein